MAGGPGARWAAEAAAPGAGCAGCGATTPAQPLLPASLCAEIQSLVSAIVRESKDMTIPSLQEEAAHLFIQIVMF